MKSSKILPEIRFNDTEPLRVNICNVKLNKKDKEIIKEVSRKVKI